MPHSDRTIPIRKKRLYAVYLVTAKHVVEQYKTLRREKPELDDIKVRLNPKESSSAAQEFPVLSNPPSPDIPTWFYHPHNVDVAIVPVNFDFLRKLGFAPGAFLSNDQVADRDQMKQLGVTAGDGAFVLGFPMSLAGIQRNYVIARQGAIARIAEMLDGRSPFFLLDAFVFPGNSGGPVVLKPDITAIEGTTPITKAYVIGIVVSYLPYADYAISPQTKHVRVSFEENSGLAEVLPVNYIEETIKAWQASRPVPATPAKP